MFLDSPGPDLLARTLLLAPIGLLWIVVIVRIIGLRTFSKMTSFDFVATIAVGSLLGVMASAEGWPTFIQAAGATLSLLTVQALLAWARRRSQIVFNWLANTPVLLVRDGVWLEDALSQTRVSKSDVIAKFREANVLRMEDVRAVILETTGDISVLHGDDFEEFLLEDVVVPAP